jgi:hypothetical protein
VSMPAEPPMDMIVTIGDMRMEAEMLHHGRHWYVWIRVGGVLVRAVDTRDVLEFIRKAKSAAALCDGAPDAKAAASAARRMVAVATEWDGWEDEGPQNEENDHEQQDQDL